MSRIEDAQFQNEVADSLLGDQQPAAEQPEESQYAVSGADLLDEAIEDQTNALKLGDEGFERARPARGEAEQQEQPPERLRSERAPEAEQVQQQQISDPTPEQVRATIQHLDTMSERFQLNEGSREFAASLEPLLGPEVYKNEAQLSNAIARYTLSARDEVLQQAKATGGFDAEQIAPLSPAMVREGARAVASFFGINPQLNPLHDERRVAEFMRLGLANFANTWGQSDGKTPVSELNDGNLAVHIVQNLVYGLWGVTEPVNRQWAINFINTITERESKLLPKIRQGLEGTNQPRSRGTQRGQRGPKWIQDGLRGSKAPRFKSNSDIFSGESLTAAMSQKL